MTGVPRIFGPYLLLESLGEGGAGQVYLAHPIVENSGLPFFVVIKCLRPELLEKRDQLSRFRHEAEMAVRLDSPYIAKVFETGAVGNEPYIAMEHISGQPLSDVMVRLAERKMILPPASAVGIIEGALIGLDALHRAADPRSSQPMQIVHRDLAPKNLIVGADYQSRIIDLGIGKSAIQGWETGTGIVLGSPGYMSPEQVMGRAYDQRLDIYTIGIVLFELLTMRRYIPRGSQVIDVLRASARPKFSRPSSLAPAVPAGLDLVLEKALAIEPERRFSTAQEFLEALRPFLPGPSERALTAQMLEEAYEHEFAPDLAQKVLDLAGIMKELAEESAPTSIYARRTIIAEQPVVIDPTLIRPPSVAPVAPPRSFGALTAAAVTATLFLGLGIVLWATRETSTPQPVEAEPEPVIAAPAAEPVVRPVAKAPPQPEPVPEVRSEPEPPPSKRVKAPAAKKPPVAREVEAPVAEVSMPERVDRESKRLIARIKALKERSPERAAELDPLLGDIALETMSRDYDRALRRLDELSKRVSVLERR